MSHYYGRLHPGAAKNQRTMRGHKSTGIGSTIATWHHSIHCRLYSLDDVDYASITIEAEGEGARILYDGRLDALHSFALDAFVLTGKGER